MPLFEIHSVSTVPPDLWECVTERNATYRWRLATEVNERVTEAEAKFLGVAGSRAAAWLGACTRCGIDT